MHTPREGPSCSFGILPLVILGQSKKFSILAGPFVWSFTITMIELPHFVTGGGYLFLGGHYIMFQFFIWPKMSDRSNTKNLTMVISGSR